jgi:hypothetical protein
MGDRPALQKTMDTFTEGRVYAWDRPAVGYLKQNEKAANSIAGELSGDFMFWPTGRHRFGWFLEPAYDYSFAGGHPQSVGMNAGLLIGVR